MRKVLLLEIQEDSLNSAEDRQLDDLVKDLNRLRLIDLSHDILGM